MHKPTTSKDTAFALYSPFKPNKLISDNPSRMIQQHPQQISGIYFSISAALLLHILLILALSYLPTPYKKEHARTVPTVTIMTGSKASTESQESQTQSANAAAANAYLTTLQSSVFKVQQTKLDQKKEQRKSQLIPQALSPNSTTKAPAKKPNKQSQTSRAQKANQGMMNIFKQKKIKKETTLVSTTKTKELSDYEISLRSILSRAVLYDQFHKFIKAKDGNEINFEITLILHPSGAIKNAIISRTSGIREIDDLAKQKAYKASPYPIPPTEDMQKGFRYAIAITYQKPAAK